MKRGHPGRPNSLEYDYNCNIQQQARRLILPAQAGTTEQPSTTSSLSSTITRARTETS
ncbi:UNVERIFIED_CONTAM: hypothetical protein FKN15_017685 [Acipenser sinensis]